MAYFDCIVGGSGGNLKLTVTCDSVFAGATISCTDGTTTLTATCPSSSPYTVIFKIPNGGTWIVSSGSDSTTVVISDTATLHQIPTGSTATPVNDIQTWLHCANIWNKNYTTINQVLADTSTLLALISSNNAADYMARSTNWASSVCANQTAMGYIGNNNYCANKLLANSTWRNAICNSTYFENVLNVKVPTMTSNTTPSGQVLASSVINSDDINQAYHAFDGIDGVISPNWSSNVEVHPWLGYMFTRKVIVYKMYISNFVQAEYSVTNFKIQASNDGNSWVDVSDSIVLSPNEKKYVVLNNTNSYQRYRIYANSIGSTGRCSIIEAQFYGR